MEDQVFYNKGGINGLGEGLTDQNSKEFKALQEAIQQYAREMTE